MNERMNEKSPYHKAIKSAKLSTRAKVILTLEQVALGVSLSALLDGLLTHVPSQDKGFAHELVFGTLRQWWALCRIADSLIKNPINDKAVLAALNIGLYQLLYLKTPDYASINQTVDAIKALDKAFASGLINAVLRKVASSPDKFFKKVHKNHSLPNFLAKQLKQDWAQDYEVLGQVLRTPAPIFVRANTHKISHADYRQKLSQAGVAFEEVALSSTVFGKSHHVQAFNIGQGFVPNLPDFAGGEVVVQDLHAQLAMSILQNLPQKPKANLLDACTAPAGKLIHWLSMLDKTDYTMTAIDNDQKRMARVYENLERLGFRELLDKKVTLKVADATTFDSDQPFDVIMLDAPCSATGVIRRHPDIGLLRQESDIDKIVALQAQILDNLWSSLAEGGFLLYITCSILKAENENQLTNFLNRHADAQEIPITADWGIAQTVGCQCLPKLMGGDGFYYALINKNTQKSSA